MIANYTIIAGTAPTLIVDATNNRDGITAALQNPTGGEVIYLGGESVGTADYGFALAADSYFATQVGQDEKLYAVSASGSATAYLFLQGL